MKPKVRVYIYKSESLKREGLRFAPARSRQPPADLPVTSVPRCGTVPQHGAQGPRILTTRCRINRKQKIKPQVKWYFTPPPRLDKGSFGGKLGLGLEAGIFVKAGALRTRCRNQPSKQEELDTRVNCAGRSSGRDAEEHRLGRFYGRAPFSWLGKRPD